MGSSGLVGSESVNFLKKFDVIGIIIIWKFFFGNEGSTLNVKKKLISKNKNFKSFNIDIKNYLGLEKIFRNIEKIFL